MSTLSTPVVLKPRVCCREGCGKVARAFGGVVVFADQDVWAGTEGIGVTLDKPLCTQHSSSPELHTLINEDEWRELCAQMIKRGLVEPAWKHTRPRVFQWYEAHESIRGRYV